MGDAHPLVLLLDPYWPCSVLYLLSELLNSEDHVSAPTLSPESTVTQIVSFKLTSGASPESLSSQPWLSFNSSLPCQLSLQCKLPFLGIG